jgi:hypothetical protein
VVHRSLQGKRARPIIGLPTLHVGSHGAIMTDRQRLFLRLRQRALQCYEYLLYAMLLALASGVALTAAAAAQDDPAQCGNSQSSAAVIVK